MTCAKLLRSRSSLILYFLVIGMLVCFVLWEVTARSRSRTAVRIPLQFSADLPGCSAIISGDVKDKKEEVEKLLASKKRRNVLSEDFYLNMTKDCDAYIKNRGFIMVPLSKEEKDFPIAYSMVIHEKIEMFERLLRAIYAPQNIYCVHVDQKSSLEFRMAVRKITSCFPNVFVASKQESVIYASWNRVQADLNCMKDLLSSHVQWRYLLNTCGTDFPIKTNGEIVQILETLQGRNSMESETANERKKGRWQYHYNVTDIVIKTDVKKSPPPISSPMFSGNAYIVVTRAFVEHVMEDGEVQKLLEWEKDTYSPDEHLWATLHRMPSVPGSLPANVKFDTSDMLAVARLVKWSYLTGDVRHGAPYSPCSGAYKKDICVYGSGDLQWLMRQRHLLANRFDPDVDDVVIRCMESVLRFKALQNYPQLTDQYSILLQNF
ncbi:uncharacterized protein V6R79_023512 [Siganus canaliculatus]